MARRNHIPAYGHHKATGQARVIIGGKHIYLGEHGSQESFKAYSRLIGDLLHGSSPTAPPPDVASAPPSLTMKELILRYWRFAEAHYVRDGKRTDEQASIRAALRFVRQLFADLQAKDFGPKALKHVQNAMIEADLSRKYINDSVNRIRRMFKWAASEELVHISVYEALRSVDGLKRGRSQARDSRPVQPVPIGDVDAVVGVVNPVVGSMKIPSGGLQREQVRSNITIHGTQLTCHINGQQLTCGELETPSLEGG
jgi:hypothetical protein